MSLSDKTDLDYLTNMAVDYRVWEIASHVIDNPKFPIWSGSVDNKHHCGLGGLLKHTTEVVMLVEMNADFFIEGKYKVNKKVLFLAALFHDIGKIWDYEPLEKPLGSHYPNWDAWQGTSHKRQIHHISRSAIEWSKAVEKTGQCKDIEDSVLHCILSHHGTREWGSPVMPHSREAWILHLCDSLSARANDCEKIDLVHAK